MIVSLVIIVKIIIQKYFIHNTVCMFTNETDLNTCKLNKCAGKIKVRKTLIYYFISIPKLGLREIRLNNKFDPIWLTTKQKS